MLRYSVRTGATIVKLDGRMGLYGSELAAVKQAKRLTKASADGVRLAPPVAAVVTETGRDQDGGEEVLCVYEEGKKVKV